MNMAGNKMTYNNPPSDEEIKAALERIRNRSRGLGEIRDQLLHRFSGFEALHEAYIHAGPNEDIYVHFFFRTEGDRLNAELNGVNENLENAFRELLEASESPLKSTARAHFEFDSDEIVQRDFAGNYIDRLK